MQDKLREQAVKQIENFSLPRYNEIPDFGLFLEQVTRYISDILAPLEGVTITNSMISNYVKKKLVANPQKKQYDRQKIAYLIFIALAKTVISIDDLNTFIQLQKKSYPLEVAYNYFCCEFENMLSYAFSLKDTPEKVGKENTELKIMLRNSVVAIVHKVYLDTCFAIINNKENSLN